MKKQPRSKAVKEKPAVEEHPQRLAELQAELRSAFSRLAADASVTFFTDMTETHVEKDKVIRFSFQDHNYSIGHTDRTYADSHHAKGVRHIQFYVDGKVVLGIEGDFEDQQFGSNFRFQSIKVYTPGDWEKNFIALSEQLRAYKAKRRLAFQKKRTSENLKRARDYSSH